MKEYDVKITETLEKTVTVQAESHDAAEEQVRAAYYNSEYILDSENFTGVAFGTTEEREVQKEQADTMNVLLVKPFMYPQAVQIGCELEDLQKAVGGDIEATYPFNEPVALLMHDEGKLAGKDLNRALRDDDGDIYDIIAGDFLVVGLGEEDFCSLSPELMKQFEEHFHQPETFVRMGRSIMALPLPDDMVKKEDAPVKADSVPHNEDKKGVCFYEVSEICRENGLKAGCVACAVRIRSDLPSGKTCRECFFLCHRSTDLIYSWLLHLLRFSISVVAAWSIGWNWAGGLCGVVPVCPVPRNRRTYQRKPT